jgi:hypothetical protein
MNEKDLRDCFAMFAMLGLIMRDKVCDAEEAWFVADKMIEARNKIPEDDGGITTIKKRKYVRKD